MCKITVYAILIRFQPIWTEIGDFDKKFGKRGKLEVGPKFYQNYKKRDETDF